MEGVRQVARPDDSYPRARDQPDATDGCIPRNRQPRRACGRCVSCGGRQRFTGSRLDPRRRWDHRDCRESAAGARDPGPLFRGRGERRRNRPCRLSAEVLADQDEARGRLRSGPARSVAGSGPRRDRRRGLSFPIGRRGLHRRDQGHAAAGRLAQVDAPP